MPETNTVGSAADVGAFALGRGTIVGRYEIVGILGQGGFGITYHARDTATGRDVAIKEYLPASLAVRQAGMAVLPRSTEIAEDFTWGRERFVAESRTLASLNDAPAIVRTYDFIEANGTAYIVMELLHGETLEAVLKRQGALKAGDIDVMLGPLLDGLEKVHGAGFLHRDIKPANLMIGADGRATLIDFGAARMAMASRSTALTAIFTPGFGAPEQFTSSNQGPWTDIYGLSATLYNAVTGAVPPSSFDRVVEDTYSPLARHARLELPPGLSAGIDMGLRVRTTERPQTIAAWRPVLSGEVIPESATATIVMRGAGQPARRSRFAFGRPAWIGAILLAVVAAAGGGYYLDSRLRQQPVSLENFKAEDLEKALAARRRADAEADQKRQAEEEARTKAQADAEAKRRADEALAAAQAEREHAERELARLREKQEAERTAAAAEEQRQAEVAMVERRAAEEAARLKATAEAESKHKADEALARAQQEREQAEAAAKAQVEAEAKMKAEVDAKSRAEAEAKERDKAAAEAKANADAQTAEAGLRLSPDDRKRLQIALSSRGFDTRGSDGNFGTRTRDMVAAWQTARKLAPTGYLDDGQRRALLQEASAALSKYDDEQKKIEDAKKADEDKKKQEAAAAPAAALVTGGSYGGAISLSKAGGGTNVAEMALQISGNAASGQIVHRVCGPYPVSLTASTGGEFKGRASAQDGGISCNAVTYDVTATPAGDALKISMIGLGSRALGTLNKGVSISVAPAAAAPAPPPAVSAAPVKFSGGMNIEATIGASAVARMTVTASGGALTGEFAVTGCATVPVTLALSPSGEVSGTLQASNGARFCVIIPYKVTGRLSGDTLRIDLAGTGSRAGATLTKQAN